MLRSAVNLTSDEAVIVPPSPEAQGDVADAARVPLPMPIPRSQSDGSFDAAYETNQLAVTLLMTHFLLDYLRELHRLFDGDLQLALILGEIGEANVRKVFNSPCFGFATLATVKDLFPEELTKGCNALSASMASGVPRETTRRKLQELAARGLIEPHPEGGWCATAAANEIFKPFNRALAKRVLETARRLEDLFEASSDA